MLLIQLSSGYGWQPLLPGVFLVLVTGFLGLQVKAARIHTSVELTPEYLRQGAETILHLGDRQDLSGGRRVRECPSGSPRGRWAS